MYKQKITIEYKYRGSVEIPDTKNSKDIFFRVKQAYANHEKMSLKLLFSNYDLKKLKSYTKGGAEEELENLEFYINLGEILDFNTQDAQKLKEFWFDIQRAKQKIQSLQDRLEFV